MRLHHYVVALLCLSGASSGSAVGSPKYREFNYIDQTQLSQFELFSDYVSAAYCKINNNSTGNEVVCGTGRNYTCPRLEAADTVTLLEFQDCKIGDTTGYVALDHTNRNIILAFRGSSSRANWKSNLRIWPAKWKGICPGCKVHSGWKAAWTKCLRLDIKGQLINAAMGYPEYDIIVGGHSLGGAMATIAIADMRRDVTLSKAVLVTFGAPRAGNAKFAHFIEHSGTNYRFTHGQDPFPHTPFASWPFKYAHIYPEYHIRYPKKSKVNITDVVRCDVKCKGPDSAWSWLYFSDHRWYFRRISGCK